MPSPAQDKFRRRVKVWLLKQNLSVTDLAKAIGRRRDTVSRAIHQGRFPRVRKAIEETMS